MEKNLTFTDILKACGNGQLPKVYTTNPKNNDQLIFGTVTTIKHNGKHFGVGVTFDGLNYESWFYESDDDDKRSRYIRDLKII